MENGPPCIDVKTEENENDMETEGDTAQFREYVKIEHSYEEENEHSESSNDNIKESSEVGDPRFPCIGCEEAFESEENLKTHARVHYLSKQWKCSFCGKILSRLVYLKSHLKIHTGEMDFDCEVHEVSANSLLMETGKRACRPTEEQKTRLVNFLSRHLELARNQLYGEEGLIKKKGLWNQIAKELNSMDGACKTVDKWIKFWSDFRGNIRNKATKHRNHDGHIDEDALPHLTSCELKVVSIISHEVDNTPELGVPKKIQTPEKNIIRINTTPTNGHVDRVDDTTETTDYDNTQMQSVLTSTISPFERPPSKKRKSEEYSDKILRIEKEKLSVMKDMLSAFRGIEDSIKKIDTRLSNLENKFP